MGLRVAFNAPHNSVRFWRLDTFERYPPAPQWIQGAPWSDVIIFGWDQPVRMRFRLWVAGFAGSGVTQTRLESGEVLLRSVKPARMCRLCWDVYDRRSGETIVETATGVVTFGESSSNGARERYTLVLYRGDVLLNHLGQLERAERGCSG